MSVFYATKIRKFCFITLKILISVLVGEPLTIDCLLDKTLALQHMNYSLTWYKSGSKMPVTQVKLSRIHQHKNLLWFMPAILEDSGSYECVMRNLTSCKKIYFSVIVFKNTAGLCFNGDFLYAQEISASSNAKIVCPHLDYFRDEKNTLPIHWYKVGCSRFWAALALRAAQMTAAEDLAR
uniref:Ig-like domain-containing protein n=1 Tax=Chrysemys picta bellii TaxID=8478 RepID=A0A8C3HTW9_CHRPI